MREVFKWLGWITLGIVALIFWGGVISAIIGDKSKPKGSETTASSQATPEPTPEVISVDMKALLAEFDANQLAAEDKYQGKLVKFEARITNT